MLAIDKFKMPFTFKVITAFLYKTVLGIMPLSTTTSTSLPCIFMPIEIITLIIKRNVKGKGLVATL